MTYHRLQRLIVVTSNRRRNCEVCHDFCLRYGVNLCCKRTRRCYRQCMALAAIVLRDIDVFRPVADCPLCSLTNDTGEPVSCSVSTRKQCCHREIAQYRCKFRSIQSVHAVHCFIMILLVTADMSAKLEYNT